MSKATKAEILHWEGVLKSCGLSMGRGLGLSRGLLVRLCPVCQTQVSRRQKVCPACEADIYDGGRNVNLIYAGAPEDLSLRIEREVRKLSGRVMPKGNPPDE